ncbi:hypothetical protein HanHA89_Chr01g0020631 [Helianthus annuus]|nr:hypothetical protein HanHA89_Chr01g0020631 [Helianthus annuus]
MQLPDKLTPSYYTIGPLNWISNSFRPIVRCTCIVDLSQNIHESSNGGLRCHAITKVH